jgi:hypothetical protein
MSVPVALAELARRVDEYGTVAYLVTVGGGLPHVVSVRVRWDGADLVVGAGRRTAANAAEHPDVTLLWPAPPGAGYSLIVDGRAELRQHRAGPVLAVSPAAAVLHRTPEGDPETPSCITVLAAR